MNGIFITGCGTDIGKTVISACILKCALAMDIRATIFKPVQTGCSTIINGTGNKRTLLPDLDFAANICLNNSKAIDELTQNFSYAYEPACSPHLAAEIAGEIISLKKIITDLQELEKKYELVIIEGAGGIMVPLNEQESFLDFARSIEYEIVVVADNKLGCINDSLLTIEALRKVDRTPYAVIMNNTTPRSQEHAFIKDNNPVIIEKFSGVPTITELPYTDCLSKDNTEFWQNAVEKLKPALTQILTRE